MSDDLFLMNSLLDFYSSLLTDKQQEICTYYYREDMSLQEIAEEMNISRSAVHDTVRRCREELLAYEAKLNMAKGFETRRKLYAEIKSSTPDPVIHDLVDRCLNSETEGGQNE